MSLEHQKYPPQGLGIYIRAISRKYHNTPIQAARRANDHGISWVSIMAIWQSEEKDKIINTQMMDYVDAFREKEIDVWLWGYPWLGRETSFIARMNQIKDGNKGKIKGVILDPEVGYKYDKVSCTRKRSETYAQRLSKFTLDSLNEGQFCGVTSYGNLNIHRTFPSDDFCIGFGSPQLYTCKTKNEIMRGLRSWQKRGWTQIVPSVPAYGPNSGQNLEQYLDWFPREVVTEGYRTAYIDAMIVWSWRQISKEEWKVLERVAKKFFF